MWKVDLGDADLEQGNLCCGNMVVSGPRGVMVGSRYDLRFTFKVGIASLVTDLVSGVSERRDTRVTAGLMLSDGEAVL